MHPPLSEATVPEATVRSQVSLPLRFLDGYQTSARLITFDGLVDGREHIAIGLGGCAAEGASDTAQVDVPLVRPHSECLTGDVLGSQLCDCGAQLREAVERIATVGGYLLYLRQEGRAIGLYAKLDAYLVQQQQGLDTYAANEALGFGADERDYAVVAQMLGALGCHRIALLSNNPDKLRQLRALGITVTEQVRTRVHLSPANAGYLAAKADRGHLLDLDELAPVRRLGPSRTSVEQP